MLDLSGTSPIATERQTIEGLQATLKDMKKDQPEFKDLIDRLFSAYGSPGHPCPAQHGQRSNGAQPLQVHVTAHQKRPGIG